MLKMLVFIWISAPASASPPACHAFSALSFPVGTCDDNEPMARDALACVRSYRDYVKKGQADVLAKFQAQIDQQKKQQSDSFDRTESGYRDARQQLDRLLAAGRTARADVDDLLANIYYPPDYDEPDVTGMSTQEYLASQKCFSVPERVLQQSQAMIDRIMSDLKATQEAMKLNQGSAAKHSAQVQKMDDGSSLVTDTHGVGTGTTVKGDSRGPASDITGTKPPGAEDP